MTAQPMETSLPNELDTAADAATEAIKASPKLEGSLPMPADLQKLRKEKLRIDEKLESLEFRKQEIKDLMEAALRAAGVKSFTINGKNKATVSEYPKAYAKTSVLETKYPHVYNDPEVVTIKDQSSVTISK